MSPSPFLTEKLFPGARTCLVVGDLDPGMENSLARYAKILWIAESRSSEVRFRRIPKTAFVRISIDECSIPQLEAHMDRFVMVMPRHLPSVYVSRAVAGWPQDRLTGVIDVVYQNLEMQQRARMTRQKDGFVWQSQLLKNTSAYALRRLPPEWAGALAGLPAFVCGAGPSFGVSAPYLAKVAAQGLVLAADSSLKALAKVGVGADFVVSVDAAKEPAPCLNGVPLPGRAVLSALSPPAWSSAIVPAHQFFVSGNQLTLDWMASVGIARTSVAVCENCGATAIEVARFLGCAPICLFGMDLALNASGPPTRHHADVDKTVYVNSGFDEAQQFPKVPGNYSPEVPTHVIGDWRQLSDRLARWPEGLVWVVTDRGARLANTTVMRPEDFALPSTGQEKSAMLARLPGALAAPPEVLRTVMGEYAQCSQLIQGCLPGIRAALSRGDIPATAKQLLPLFREKHTGMILGAFSLKLMPHLVPPLEEKREIWEALVTELAGLSEILSSAGNP
jgi:hypothetical protein